jgi:hypothetical protein
MLDELTGDGSMHRCLAALAALPILFAYAAFAGEAEVNAAQSSIAGQLKAFSAGDNAGAYSFAAPNVKRIFPSLDAFMGMVTSAYQPVYRPKSYAFGKVEQLSATSIIQQVLVVGPDGKDYEAVYTLEMQPDGMFRITGVSLRASNSLST